MALKEMFQAMKKEGYVTAPLDRFLFEQANKPNDRAVNVNAPSQAGKCNRANYYMRMQYENDGSIDPRTQRIFDNGTYTHERLQSYLIEMDLLHELKHLKTQNLCPYGIDTQNRARITLLYFVAKLQRV